MESLFAFEKKPDATRTSDASKTRAIGYCVAFRVRDFKLSRVRIFNLIFASTAAVMALCLNIPASIAFQTGDSHWCHVQDKGDIMSWDCDYDSIDECQPVIVNGGGGWCSINPTWHPEPQQSESAPAADTVPAQAVPIPRPRPH
jgi:hypothetical protein